MEITKAKTKVVGFRIPEGLLNKLNTTANSTDKLTSEVLRDILRAHYGDKPAFKKAVTKNIPKKQKKVKKILPVYNPWVFQNRYFSLRQEKDNKKIFYCNYKGCREKFDIALDLFNHYKTEHPYAEWDFKELEVYK